MSLNTHRHVLLNPCLAESIGVSLMNVRQRVAEGKPSDWILINGRDGSSTRLEREMLFVGRSECDIQLDSPTLDSRHAVICYSPEESVFYLKDLNTFNGTFVDESRIPCQTYVKLHPQNRLRFGLSPDIFTVEKRFPPSNPPPDVHQEQNPEIQDQPAFTPRLNVASVREVKEEALKNARHQRKSNIFSREESDDSKRPTDVQKPVLQNLDNRRPSERRVLTPVWRTASSIFGTEIPSDAKSEMEENSTEKLPPAAPTAFTISFDDEVPDGKKKREFNIRKSIREFAPHKPSLEASKSVRKKEQQNVPQETRDNLLSDGTVPHENQSLSDSAAYLINRMLQSQESSSSSDAAEDTSPTDENQGASGCNGEHDSGVCDDKSESGTYTLEVENQNTDVEKARQMIDEVFGLNYVKNNAPVPLSDSSADSTPTHTFKKRSGADSKCNSSRENDVNTLDADGQRTFTRSTKRRGSLEYNQAAAPVPPNFVRTFSLRNKKGQPQTVSESPVFERKSYARRESVSSSKSGGSSKTVELRKSSCYSRSSPVPVKTGSRSLMSSMISADSAESDPPSGGSNKCGSDANTSSSLKLNRAFALRRARLGIETPGVPLNLSRDKPPKVPNDRRSNSFNRNDGGRFSLRIPSASGSSRKPPVGPSGSGRPPYDLRKQAQVYSGSHTSWTRGKQGMDADGGRRSSASSVQSEVISYSKPRREASFSGNQSNRMSEKSQDIKSRGSPFLPKKNYSPQAERRQQANVAPIQRMDIMTSSVTSDVPVSRSQTRVLSALDHLVVTAILQLSSKLRTGMREFLENEQLKYPVGSDTRLMIQEILPQVSGLETRLSEATEGSLSLSKDLSTILKNLKKVEQSLEVMSLLAEIDPDVRRIRSSCSRHKVPQTDFSIDI